MYVVTKNCFNLHNGVFGMKCRYLKNNFNEKMALIDDRSFLRKYFYLMLSKWLCIVCIIFVIDTDTNNCGDQYRY